MVRRIRAADPLAGVRSTFILGFPGESEEDAGAVEGFVNDTDLDWVGTFTYSREDGTASHDLPDQISEEVARERAERVSAAAELTMDRRARALGGHSLEVLVERFDRETGSWTGRSHREAPEVDGEIRFATEDALRVGDYVRVSITGNDGADLLGVALASESV
jgi:tRNA A37 methylthiotransferase MiaB